MLPAHQHPNSSASLLDSEDETVMAELPFVTADAREIFENPLKHECKPQRKKRKRILENPQLGRGKLCRRLKLVKWQSCRSRHQERVLEHVQGDENPAGAQQLCSAVQLGQGGGYFPATQLLPPEQQPWAEDNAHALLQRQTVQGGMAPNRGPQPRDQGWEALEVTVKVRPQEVSQRWESPEVTVQVQPQKPSPRWVAPSVTTQVQLQQQGQGPQVIVQVQQQGQSMAGIKITVQLGCELQEVTCLQDQGEEVSTNGEQLTREQNEGEQVARSEGERELAEVKLEPQGVPSQKQDQGEVTEALKNQNQEEERAEVVALQQIEDGDTADLNGILTEEQLQGQSQEQKQPEADLPPQKEGQSPTETRQNQRDAQEGPKDQKEALRQETSKKRPREAANYFVAIPITNDQILDRIEDVQELIFTKEPLLLKALLPIQTMHITLIIAHLGTEDIKKAVLALKQSKTKVEAILQSEGLHMTFQGIGRFNDQVLYVDMLEEGKKMLTRITAVEECFVEMNLDISGSKDFIPHLTFLKLSKVPSLKRRGFTKIPPELYKEFKDSYFGTEVFSRIDLCAMKKKKQESGYYYCEGSIHVGSTTMEKNKEQEMQTDVGGALREDLPHSSAKAEVGEALREDLPHSSAKAEVGEALREDLPHSSAKAEVGGALREDIPHTSAKAEVGEALREDLPQSSAKAEVGEALREDLPYSSAKAEVGEALREDLPHSSAKAEMGETAASPKLTSHLVVADDKTSENIAEASTPSEEEINEVKGQPEATDEISDAAGEICSKAVLGLLPASSDVLECVEKEEEEEMRTDGSLQKTEATGHASDQPPSSG
ncbi:uncharacterized protein LOC135178850 isoform X2 [Pogoniulus pusillus]|uniref:uncharacterized protein LOC135178850 isoform X2 n=1 Tax=Pogoniulus pusillus TaxID=488313 RepID=UPI0030B95AE2